MESILQIKINGIKNIENEICIDFINTIVEKGIKSVDKVKGIFGYNGAGKTAIITAIDIYKNIVTDINYLNQNDVKEELIKLINYKNKQLSLSVLYHVREDTLLKHSINLAYKEFYGCYCIEKEEIGILSDRSINGKYKNLLESHNGTLLEVDKKNSSSLTDNLHSVDLEMCSFVPYAVKKIITEKQNKDATIAFSKTEELLLKLFLSANKISVYLKQTDNHKNYKIDKNKLVSMIDILGQNKEEYINSFSDIYMDEEIIPASYFKTYSDNNKKLTKFIQYFKPDLKTIELIKREDKKSYHIRRLFKYKNYNVEYEFESSGIKQLVMLFTYLLNCANGGIVFIDEMDTNLNSAYFTAIISFFAQYGKGQLIFTTHNLEAMNSLKSHSKSILVLGENNSIDVWVGKGNRSPIKDYLNGNFPNSPMNIEDFDFVNIFFGDEQAWFD